MENSDNNKLATNHRGGISRISNSLTITSKLLSKGVNEIFNEAFYLINSYDLKKGEEDFCFFIENDRDYLKRKEFSFTPSKTTECEKAIKLLDKVIEMRPEFAHAYAFRALAKVWIEDYAGALDDHDFSIGLDPSNAFFFKFRGDTIYRCPIGRYGHESGEYDYEAAIESYTKAIELAPDFYQAYADRGDAKDELKDYQGAIEDFSKAIEIMPEYDSLYSSRGHYKIKLGDLNGAFEDYTKAIQLKPNYCLNYLHRGHCYIYLKEYYLAIDEFNRYLELGGSKSIGFIYRGKAKGKLRDYLGALNDFEKVIELYPKNREAYCQRALLKKNDLKDYKGAIQDFIKAIELDSRYFKTHYYLGKCRLKNNDYQNAIIDFSNCIKLKHNYAKAFLGRSEAKQKLGDFIGADADILKYNRYKK